MNMLEFALILPTQRVRPTLFSVLIFKGPS